jgi:hypothetical protein
MQHRPRIRKYIICIALLGAALFVGCATSGKASEGKAAKGAVIDDQLADLSKMFSHSSDLDFDVKNPAAWPNGDASRAWPTTGDPQNFVYKLKDISSFAFVVGYYTYKHPDNPKLHSFQAFVSSDGNAWTEVSSTSDAADNGCWLFTTWKPSAEIPAGSNFVKFEFADKDLHWSTEVSGVKVFGR